MYNDLTECKNMVIGLSSNKFVREEELEIHTYKTNSIIKIDTPNIYLENTETIEEYSDTETTISSD